MSDVNDLPLEPGDAHVVDPPIVDYLFYNADRSAYAVTFVPQDSVSSRQKEVVEISQASSEGIRIAHRLREIGALLGGEVSRIFHAGGGDFGFYLSDDQLYQMSERSPSSAVRQQLYGLLREVSTIAEVAFCHGRAPTAKTA